MIKPFLQINLTKVKRVFNYRLCRKKRIFENGFGTLVGKWELFRRPITLNLEKVEMITTAANILHKWLRNESSLGKTYIPFGLADC